MFTIEMLFYYADQIEIIKSEYNEINANSYKEEKTYNFIEWLSNQYMKLCDEKWTDEERAEIFQSIKELALQTLQHYSNRKDTSVYDDNIEDALMELYAMLAYYKN